MLASGRRALTTRTAASSRSPRAVGSTEPWSRCLGVRQLPRAAGDGNHRAAVSGRGLCIEWPTLRCRRASHLARTTKAGRCLAVSRWSVHGAVTPSGEAIGASATRTAPRMLRGSTDCGGARRSSPAWGPSRAEPWCRGFLVPTSGAAARRAGTRVAVVARPARVGALARGSGTGPGGSHRPRLGPTRAQRGSAERRSVDHASW